MRGEELETNWKKSGFTLTILILIILSTFFMQTNLLRAQASLEGTVASTELINFYSMTTGEVTTFVEILDAQNISLFIVRLNAFSEWSSGTSSGITKTKQIITTANAHGIEVAVDLHTWYTTWDNYFDDSASNHDANRADYIEYVENVLTSFASSNVYAFMVMNEPQAQTASSSENQFILNVIVAANEVTSKPISVRFMGGYSPTTRHYGAAIDQASDFICRNTYWDARNPGRTVYGTTEEILLAALNSAHAQSKPFWITEFGKTKRNLEEQRSYVEAFVEWANEEDVDAVFCWVSQPDQSGENYNIFTGYTPHPAFYELMSDELPPSPPPESDILFEDSFESGTLDLWTGTVTSSGETVTVTSDEAYHSTHSVRFTKTGSPSDRESAYIYKRISMQEAYANGYFLIDDSTESQILTDEGDVVYLMLFSDGTQSLARAGIRREEEIVKWLLNAGGIYVTAPIAVSTDCWYNIELHWNAVEGIAEMFVDGTKILEITVSDSYKINAISVDIGIISATNVQNQLTVYADCFRLSNTYVGPEIALGFPPWDVNQDGCVNYADAIIVGLAQGSTPESPNWDPRADVNSDETVNFLDAILVTNHFGEQYI